MPVSTAVSRHRAGGETITYLPAVGGTTLTVTTDELWTIEFSRVRPVRGCPSFKGKKSFSGQWWCATTHRHVTFESWVERDFLIDADFDFRVCGIAAQPFRLPSTPVVASDVGHTRRISSWLSCETDSMNPDSHLGRPAPQSLKIVVALQFRALPPDNYLERGQTVSEVSGTVPTRER